MPGTGDDNVRIRVESAQMSSWSTTAGLVLWSGTRDVHWTVAALDTLHLSESALLITHIGEANKPVAVGHTIHAGYWVGHNFGRLATWEAKLDRKSTRLNSSHWE